MFSVLGYRTENHSLSNPAQKIEGCYIVYDIVRENMQKKLFKSPIL